MQYITETEIDRITTDTCRALAKEKRVAIRIEPEDGEDFWEGGINGHFFRIRTGETVEVPESLALLITASRRVQRESAKRLRAYTAGGGRKLG